MIYTYNSYSFCCPSDRMVTTRWFKALTWKLITYRKCDQICVGDINLHIEELILQLVSWTHPDVFSDDIFWNKIQRFCVTFENNRKTILSCDVKLLAWSDFEIWQSFPSFGDCIENISSMSGTNLRNVIQTNDSLIYSCKYVISP